MRKPPMTRTHNRSLAGRFDQRAVVAAACERIEDMVLSEKPKGGI
jgi:hypothetical protein